MTLRTDFNIAESKYACMNTVNKEIEIEPMRVILVDDDPDDCEIFRVAAKKSGVPINLCVFDGAPRLLNDPFILSKTDVVFLDINMHKMDGKECLKLIRAMDKYSTVPIIMFSTSGYAKDIDDAFQLGATYYLQKPHSILSLIKTLNIILSRKISFDYNSARESFYLNKKLKEEFGVI